MLKIVSKKLESSRSKIKRQWASYRREKKHILRLKKLAPDLKRQRIASIYDDTVKEISKTWHDYREEKYAVTHKSPYADFSFVKKLTGMYREVSPQEIDPKTGKPKIEFFHFHNSYQKIYKAKRGYDVNDLDNVLLEILRDPKVKGVLVVFKIVSEETDNREFVSNYVNLERMERLHADGVSIYEDVLKNFRAGSTKDYELKFIYLRVVYKKG
ncbi:MAG: hypothetical protein GYA62_05220 [Bacteroidales bacterium]|nr:hypothetical protein [Bacteroidales bacterium]